MINLILAAAISASCPSTADVGLLASLSTATRSMGEFQVHVGLDRIRAIQDWHRAGHRTLTMSQLPPNKVTPWVALDTVVEAQGEVNEGRQGIAQADALDRLLVCKP